MTELRPTLTQGHDMIKNGHYDSDICSFCCVEGAYNGINENECFIEMRFCQGSMEDLIPRTSFDKLFLFYSIYSFGNIHPSK
jgi:hypothetical protein